MQKVCQHIVDSRAFHIAVIVVISLSGLELGLETFPTIERLYGHLFDEIDAVILSLFGIELAVRVGAYGRRPWRFFASGWNIFDLLVFLLPILPLSGPSSTFAKALRVFRLIKIFRVIPEIKILLNMLFRSSRYILSICLLLGVFFYSYAVAAVFIFGENDRLHFRDLWTSMLTMFRVVTLEDWTDVMYINMFGCANYGYEFRQELCAASYGHPVEASLFFVSFVILATMIVLNLLIAVIVESMQSRGDEKTEVKATEETDITEELSALGEQLLSLSQKVTDLKSRQNKAAS